jgi:Mrp family chromosome partitioning ATPase/capsular polysaccharide biosynthesis protein
LNPGSEGLSTLRQYAHTLWRRKWVLLVPAIALPLVTFVATSRQPALYEATADVLLNRQSTAATSLIGQTPGLDDEGRAIDTQVRIARLQRVLERTLAAAGVRGRSEGSLRGHSEVFPLASILRFSVTDEDPALAPRLATEYAREFVRYRRELDTVGLAAPLRDLRAELAQLEATGRTGSAQYNRLADRERQLESLQALSRSNVSLVQPARPGDQEQVAPRPLRNTALAAVVGLVAGLILVALWETLTTRPRSDDEVEGLLGMPLLGRLRLPGGGTSGGRAGGLDPDAPEDDAVAFLRTNLELATAGVRARSIMVTSLDVGQGAGTTAASTAVALARAGRRVVLVDLDLRSSSTPLAEFFGVDGARGATSLARGECTVDDAVVAIPVGGAEAIGPATTVSANGRGERSAMLELVAAGPPTDRPADLASSASLAGALTALEERADVVLVVVPALLAAADAATVSARVDAVVLVVGARQARRPSLARARRVLDTWPAVKLGFVLTEGADRRRGTQARPAQPTSPSARTGSSQPERVT